MLDVRHRTRAAWSGRPNPVDGSGNRPPSAAVPADKPAPVRLAASAAASSGPGGDGRARARPGFRARGLPPVPGRVRPLPRSGRRGLELRAGLDRAAAEPRALRRGGAGGRFGPARRHARLRRRSERRALPRRHLRLPRRARERTPRPWPTRGRGGPGRALAMIPVPNVGEPGPANSLPRIDRAVTDTLPACRRQPARKVPLRQRLRSTDPVGRRPGTRPQLVAVGDPASRTVAASARAAGPSVTTDRRARAAARAPSLRGVYWRRFRPAC